MEHRILLSNLGYARGLNGSMLHHMALGYRHLWCPPGVQMHTLAALKALIRQQAPDICCLLEIENGASPSSRLNHLELLKDAEYFFSDAENKYAPNSRLRQSHFTSGKSNGFIARREYDFQKLYFSHGTKRLIYSVELEPELTLFFTHFSLTHKIRQRQLEELFDLADKTEGEVIMMGDFNLLKGLDEVLPLLLPRKLTLLNDPELHTFLLYRRRLVLDLCICSESLAEKAKLHVLPQPYSDHAALLLELNT